jgi:hypothetical protein
MNPTTRTQSIFNDRSILLCVGAGLTAVRRRNITLSPLRTAGLPQGKHNAGSPKLTANRSTGRMARPAVPLAETVSIPMDSSRSDARRDGNPEISNAQDSTGFRRRRISKIGMFRLFSDRLFHSIYQLLAMWVMLFSSRVPPERPLSDAELQVKILPNHLTEF